MPEMQQDRLCFTFDQRGDICLQPTKILKKLIANIAKSYLQVLFHFWYLVFVFDIIIMFMFERNCFMQSKYLLFNFFRLLSIFNFAVAIRLCKAKGALHPGMWQSHDYLKSVYWLAVHPRLLKHLGGKPKLLSSEGNAIHPYPILLHFQ